MGKFVLINPYIGLENGLSSSTLSVALQTYVKSATLNYSRAEVDNTCMTDIGIGRLPGLRDWSLDLEFAQDFADNLLDEILYSAATTTKASLAVTVRPTTAGVGTGNPNYRGYGIVFEYTPASGGVGDLGTASVSIRCAGNAATTLTSSWLRRTTATLN